MKKKYLIVLEEDLVRRYRSLGRENLSRKLNDLFWQYLYAGQNGAKRELTPFQTATLTESAMVVARVAKDNGYATALKCAKVHVKDVLPKVGVEITAEELLQKANIMYEIKQKVKMK